MQRLWSRTRDEQIEYHLHDGRAPEFDKGQPGRIELARFLVDKILAKELTERPLKFVELGCGAGDITGPYSASRWMTEGLPSPDGAPWEGFDSGDPEMAIDRQIEVHGYDVVPMAKEVCARRWPNMQFTLADVEDIEPYDCDLLVMCEFLEHLDDPIKIVRRWLPKARWAIIGHPLNEGNPPIEPGHIWSYTLEDWHAWFPMGQHYPMERFVFPMGSYPEMIMGHSCRADQPPIAGR